MRENTFKVEIDIETMEDIRKLISFASETYPFITKRLFEFDTKLHNIIQRGCFKHNLILEIFYDMDGYVGHVI